MTSFVGGVQRTGPLHSSIGQLEWLSYQSGGSGNLENIGWVVPVLENTPEGTVEKVTAALLDRHEALPSTYGADPLGRPQQTVYGRVDPTFSAISSTEVRAFVDQPFAVATEPPIRFGCTDDGQLVFAVAHITVDGLAAWILYKELAAALGEGGGTSEEPPAVQPLDHALREVGADRPRAEAALRHWEVVLRQIPVTVLPLTKGLRGADIDNGRSAVVSPEFFVMERSDGTSVEGRGTDRPQLGPVSAADHALRDALDWTQGLGSATTAGTYLSVGGRMFLAPRVIGRLRAHGYGNITVDDFRRPISLRALAGLLRRLDCPGDAAPATVPE